MGVVAVGAVAILGVLVYLLTGGTLLVEKATLYLYIPDATGVGQGTAVRVNGIAVGKVDQVKLSGSNQPDRTIVLTMNVERPFLPDIPVDSTAQISAEGVTGDKYVDITQGRNPARIRSGGTVAYKAAPELTKTLDLQQFAQRLRSVDDTITDIEQGKGFIGQFVTGTDMYEQTRNALVDIERQFQKAVSISSSGGHILRTDELYQRIEDPLVDLDQKLERIQTGQGQMGRLLRDDRQYVQLRDQAGRLRKMIADYRAQPFFTSDELYVSWTRGVGTVIQRVDRINTSPLMSNSMAYDNLTGFLHELRTTIHDFQNNPQKYMHLKVF